MVKLSATSNDQEVAISVTDNGVGIAARNLGTLFEIRKDKSKIGTAGEKGSGIGLKLVHSFIKLNQGDIQVESTEGQGTTFTLIFPKK